MSAGAPRRSWLFRALPFALVGAVATLVALAVVVGAGWTGSSDAPAAAASIPVGGADAGAEAPETTIDPERARLLELGQRLVRPVAQRPAALPIRLQTASFGDGSVFDLAEERGNVVVVFFMAAWCWTCIPETEALAQIHEQYADQGVRVLILDVDTTENEGDLAEFRNSYGAGEHLWAMDLDVEVARTYEVLSLDTTIFIDREGRVAYRDGSPTPYDTLAAVIEALL